MEFPHWIYINESCKCIGTMNLSKRSLSLHILKILYFTPVHSHLKYSLLAWVCRLNKLLQKQVIRIKTVNKYNANTEPLMKTLRYSVLCPTTQLTPGYTLFHTPLFMFLCTVLYSTIHYIYCSLHCIPHSTTHLLPLHTLFHTQLHLTHFTKKSYKQIINHHKHAAKKPISVLALFIRGCVSTHNNKVNISITTKM